MSNHRGTQAAVCRANTERRRWWLARGRPGPDPARSPIVAIGGRLYLMVIQEELTAAQVKRLGGDSATTSTGKRARRK